MSGTGEDSDVVTTRYVGEIMASSVDVDVEDREVLPEVSGGIVDNERGSDVVVAVVVVPVVLASSVVNGIVG